MEKFFEVGDKYYLLAWGLKRMHALKRRRFVTKVVTELKRRFKKVLYMYQDKKAEQNFEELKNLIENYDNDGKKKFGLLQKKRKRSVGMENSLQTVEEDELEESVMKDLTEGKHSRLEANNLCESEIGSIH
mmetsp:Transcript_24850/g.24334  ORF Transcript_24850/g.24334 Transcript_24850/m.24334 type:complete len:131 (+) Transcript_24850:941-1333(+)